MKWHSFWDIITAHEADGEWPGGFVVGATVNYLVSCHLWLPLNWKIEFFECALKLKVFLACVG